MAIEELRIGTAPTIANSQEAVIAREQGIVPEEAPELVHAQVAAELERAPAVAVPERDPVVAEPERAREVAELVHAQVAAELEHAPAVAEPELVQVEAVPERDPAVAPLKTKSAIAAHPRGQVPLLVAEEVLAAAVVEIMRAPAVTEAATVWAAAE